VDFWAEWCGPCRSFGPVFDRVSQRHTDVVYAKVDTQAQRSLAARFKISGVPTLMVIKNNVILQAKPGALPLQELEELIGKARDGTMDAAHAPGRTPKTFAGRSG